jgi:tol-pal system protein YbgF
MFKQLACGAAILVMAVTNAFAQARIIDSEPIGDPSSYSKPSNSTREPRQAEPVAQLSSQSELYYQVQLLQQEVQSLRGIVEQQENDLKRLKQQRLDDYVDIDRRLSQLSGSTASQPVEANQNSEATDPNSDTAPDPDPDTNSAVDGKAGSASVSELNAYRSAIDLVLKKRDFDGGITGLKSYLKQFPRGLYAANSQYWLGQIYLQKEDFAQAKKWFELMIKDYPTHQKIPEVKFKLGKIYHSLGDNEKAKNLLKQAANSSDPVAAQARDYLKQNF